jgi:NAD(P)H-flavin reductase
VRIHDPMLPRPHRVGDVARETRDVVTFTLAPADDAPPDVFAPGQFNMLYAFGIGEVPISMSGYAPDGRAIAHTVRDVGAVSHALAHAAPGDLVGVRGPYGTAWPVDRALGKDVVVVAGGIGLAPVRPLIRALLAQRERFGRICVLYGARTPEDLIFREEVRAWDAREDLQMLVTVDAADDRWSGHVGVVTKLLRHAAFDPDQVACYVCGPEVMMRFTIRALHEMGVADGRIFLSLERNMECAIGLCGHCQLGPEFVCMDGAVFAYPDVADLLSVAEL